MREEPQTRLLFVAYITDGDSPPKSENEIRLRLVTDTADDP